MLSTIDGDVIATTFSGHESSMDIGGIPGVRERARLIISVLGPRKKPGI